MAVRLFEILVGIFLVGCIVYGLVGLGGVLLSMGPIGIVIVGLLIWLYHKSKEKKQNQ